MLTNKKDCRCKKELVNKPLCLFCGQGGNAEFSSPDDPPVNIGSVTVDTRELCEPLVRFKFSSIVNLTGLANLPQALLTFRLFRGVDNGVPMPLNSWVYEAFQINNINTELRLNTSFAFIFCDRLNLFRLSEYFVEVSVDNLVNATISVDDVQIQAIAQ
ncbi:DUF4489 domain-containing protein [Vallitalea okinawensis]|uniref:DUF4489 domain-containing protein n=1 Tax=Vallitalea okinawensis TaxID=2078660 RepID=UPI000CFABC18|nr:DUF4489 domain-containing protein [Vallitalea okinawensis]